MLDFLKRIFSTQLPPILSKNEITDFGKVTVFVGWFIRHDQAVNKFVSNASNIFDSDNLPSFWDENILRDILLKYSNQKEWSIGNWFTARIFTILNSSVISTMVQLKNFLDSINEMRVKSADKLWRIAQQYNLTSNNILLEPEIEKIIVKQDKIDFLKELLDTYCIGTEMRILIWIYQKYFNEEYKSYDVEIMTVLRKWNNSSTEDVYWELMRAGAGEDVARRVISDKNLLDKYFKLRAQLRQEGISNGEALRKIAYHMLKEVKT